MLPSNPAQLEELENTYRLKISGEMERYDVLIREREAMNTEFKKAHEKMLAMNEAAVKDLQAGFSTAITAEEKAAAELVVVKSQLSENFSQLADDIETFVDADIEDLRTRYEAKLTHESKVRPPPPPPPRAHTYTFSLHTPAYPISLFLSSLFLLISKFSFVCPHPNVGQSALEGRERLHEEKVCGRQ